MASALGQGRSVRRIALSGFILLFLAPYALAFVLSGLQFHFPADGVELILRSLAQAGAASLLALLIGSIGAIGLLSVSRRWDGLVLLPVIAPSLVPILAFFIGFPTWRGWTAVVALQGLISAGLVAVVLTRQIQSHATAAIELALIEGAGRWRIWRHAVLPRLFPELVGLALSLTIAHLASFSIPLMLGGPQAVNLEIAIQRAIRFQSAWDVAGTLSLLQWLLLLTFVILAGRFGPRREHRQLIGVPRWTSAVQSALGDRRLLLVVVAGPLLLLFTLLVELPKGIAEISAVLKPSDWLDLIKGSFVTSTLAGALTALLLLGFALLTPSPGLRQWVSGYVSPSVAITGFATLAIGWGQRSSFALDSLRMAVGAALLFAPVLWRLRWEGRLLELAGQVQVAESLGAGRALIARRVLWPQLRDLTGWSAGLTAFWFWGDFSIGSVVASRPLTLGLVGKTLLDSYRANAASVLIVVMLAGGALSYFVFSQFGRREFYVGR